MKNNFKFLFACLLLCSGVTYAQVGVGTTTPDASSMLEITSTTKGFLMPRMTTTERTAIATPATGLQVYDTTTNSQWFYNGTTWVEASNSTNSLWKQDSADQISLTFPNGNEDYKYTNKGFKNWDKTTLQNNTWDGTTSTIVNKDYRTTGNSGNSYNNWFTLSNNIFTEDASTTAHVANYNQLSATSSETRANKQFYSSNNVVQVESSNTVNIAGLRAGVNTASHFGTGIVTTMMGVTGSSNVYSNAKATNMYGGFFSANANSSNIITNLIGSYSTLNINVAQTAAINNAFGIQTAINLPVSGNTNVTNLANLRTSVTLPITYTGTITNYYDLYAADSVPTSPGTITNKYGLYILGLTKNNFLEGSLGIGTSIPTAKLHVNGYAKLGSTDSVADLTLSAGLIRYNSGLQVYDGSTWSNVAIGTFWKSNGNSGTTAGTNFIGTTDNIDFVLKRNNIQSGLLSSTNTSFGYSSLPTSSTGVNNTAFGTTSLSSNSTGANNTSIGWQSMALNTSGVFNTSVGRSTLESFTTGTNNTAIGSLSMRYTTSGDNNSTLGYGSIFNLISGNNNIAIGSNSGYTLTSGSNNIFIGVSTNAVNVTGSNQLNIGNAIFGSGLTGSVSSPAGNIGIGVTLPIEKLEVNGAIKIGNTSTATPTAGTIKWDGTHFYGYTGSAWVQLDN